MRRYYTVEQTKNPEQQNGCTERSKFWFLIRFLGSTFKERDLKAWEIFSLVTKKTVMVLFVLFSSFTYSLCNRYDAEIRPYNVFRILKKNQDSKNWNNSGIINPLFDGLTYNTSSLLIFFLAPTRLGKIMGSSQNVHRIRCLYFSSRNHFITHNLEHISVFTI